MGTSLQTQHSGLGELAKLLEQFKQQIAMALPRHLTPERMIRIALTAVSTNPGLMECSKLSLAGAVVQSSILGLEPNTILGESYLVPFKPKNGPPLAQLVVGYKGLLKLVRNTGQLSWVDAQAVHERDLFECEKGLNPILRHVRANGERGGVIGYWAAYKLKDGAFNFEYMTVLEIQKHRDKFSRAANSSSSPWTTAPDWMFKKTVLRQLCKLMPMSVQAQTAVALDEMTESGSVQRFSVDVPIELHPVAELEAPETPAPAEPKRKSGAPAEEAQNG